MIFFLRRLYFTGNDPYKDFLVFAPILASLILDSNKKGFNWISTGISFEKKKRFETNFQPTILI